VIAEPLLPLARPVGELRLLDGNPRRGDVAAVKRSLQRFGQRKPIVAREDGTVIAGNHTLLAAIELGWPEIAVVGTGDDEATGKAFALADNRTSVLGSFDLGDLALMAAEVHAVDPGLLEAASFTEADLNAMAAGQRVPEKHTDPDAVPEPPAERVTCPGDLWLLGPHRLLCGDATVVTDVERLMGDDRATLIYTDPPYGVEYEGGTKKRDMISGDDAGHDTLRELFGAAFVAADLVGAERCGVIQWHADRAGMPLYDAVREHGWQIRAQIIWNKNIAQYGALSAHYKQKHEPALYCIRPAKPPKWNGLTNEVTVWNCNRAMRNDWHPTQKPVELGERAICNHTDRGDVVLDLYGGSGATLIAAHATNRDARVMELDPAYCDVICRRYQEHTGTKPVLEATGVPHDFTA